MVIYSVYQWFFKVMGCVAFWTLGHKVSRAYGLLEKLRVLQLRKVSLLAYKYLATKSSKKLMLRRMVLSDC